MIKRIASLVIAAALMLSVAGCGKPAVSTPTDTTSPTVTTTPTGTPVPEKPVTVKVLKNFQTGVNVLASQKEDGTINDNRIINAHREKSGIDIQFEYLPENQSDREVKVAMIMASGDTPDLISLQKVELYKYAAQGAVTVLDDYINKFCPEYIKITPKESLACALSDGKAIAFVERYTDVSARQGIIVRKDIMAELNLQDPKSLDELYTLLKTVKEKKNIIPLTFATSPLVEPIMGIFGICDVTVDIGGKLEFTYTQPEFKEYLTTMKKWFDEGLIDKEFALQKITGERISAERAFAHIADWASYVGTNTHLKALKEKNPKAEMGAIAFIPGKDGKAQALSRNPYGQMYAIPTTAKQKDAAAKLINYFCSEESGKIQDYGIEGKDYKVENGSVVFTPEQATAVGWKVMYQVMTRQESFLNRVKAKGFETQYNPFLKLSEAAVIKNEYTLSAPPVEKYDKNFLNLKTFVEQYATKVIMGTTPISDFDKYVAEFNTKGGQEAIDALNEVYTKK